jgi:hypothetical protein
MIEWRDSMEDLVTIHCAIHGDQIGSRHLIEVDGCPVCYDEFMKKLDKAWPRGCPKGYGEDELP